MAQNLHDSMLSLLERHLSGTHARLVLGRSIRACGLTGQPTERNLPELVPQIEKTVRFFLEGNKLDLFRRELDTLSSRTPPSSLVAKTIPIEVEDDIVGARAAARDLAVALGGSKLLVQKVATVVSELARNIVSYTPGGEIELIPSANPPTIAIRASDRGSGIGDLETIFSGQYKSKTGLGRGLYGSRKLADRLDVQTGASGTQIEASFKI